MCSGTESPLLALDEISKALVATGRTPMQIQQELSAEIEVLKQGYIERNFAPKRLFRDVRDFIRESATTAVTAYGAEVDIPTDVDILIAGFVCKDLSRLNTRGKTLDDGGESGDTFQRMYAYTDRFRPSIVLLENVKNEKKTWDDVVRRFDKTGYEAQWIYCETKNYYLPQTRERMYMIAIERTHSGKGVKSATSQWKDLMRNLERQCSSPYEAFLPDSLKESSGYSLLKNEPDWALCKLRNDHIRSEKRLGILSPISRRSDNGTVLPPDFVDSKFYISQSSRVHDAIDIAHLEAAAKGYDSLYKMALWDVSQNVDRFKADLGIAPCITLGGQDFVSNRQHALNGSQLSMLQEMPLDRLLFANETHKDLQNLAGNAMSTTVIGASLISALIVGCKAFHPYQAKSGGKTLSAPLSSNMITEPGMLKRTFLQPSTYEDLNLVKLQQEAKSSARMCNCEGKQTISKSAIQICSACGYSVCSSCAGNPKHVYRTIVPASHRITPPDEFIRRWRQLMPSRLKFDVFPDISHLASKLSAKDPILDGYLATVSEAQLGSHNPVAQATVADTLLNVEWIVRIPPTKGLVVDVSGSSEKISSCRSRLGLSDYKEETVPRRIKIKSDSLTAIVGDYEHLSHCGTAFTSLYKRSIAVNDMYMFLDPDPIGRPEHDSFVFSRDHTRKHYGLGWRAEAQVKTEKIVRSGVLADQPSFGKTVASIGLIQSEFHQVTPEKLIKRNQSLAAEQPQRLDSAATLVVCPPHITHQWSTELQEFLGSEEFEDYNVLIIENYSQLKSLTIDDFLQSRIVIVSWTLFSEEGYISELAKFTALPEPLKTSRRAFSCWLDKAVSEIPSQLAVYQRHDYKHSKRLTEQLLDERLLKPEFQATLPVKILHGAAYESFSTQLPSRPSKRVKTKAKSEADSSSNLAPLLHLFQFNRIIVDEYHYLNDNNKIGSNFVATSIKKIAAHKRWCLSGTPALANFSDVNQLASFLGVKLGRYFCGDGTVTTSAEKISRLDQTDIGSFLSQTEVMSRQWHEGRYQRAQEFLDNFVRQNEAELRHIQCSEKLLSVDLDVAHHALYLELSQYLISQKMQIKKLNKKSGSDRSSRLNGSLEGSASAEEALLRCALLFETEEGRSALQVLIEKRSRQLRSTEKELLRLLSEFEGSMKQISNTESSIKELYGHYKKDVTQYNWLGDDESSQRVRAMLETAQKTPRRDTTAIEETSKVQRERMIKQQLSQLRDILLNSRIGQDRNDLSYLSVIIYNLQLLTRFSLFAAVLLVAKALSTFNCSSLYPTADILHAKSVLNYGLMT
ncbi:unnamed protein product [Alternaria alternata]